MRKHRRQSLVVDQGRIHDFLKIGSDVYYKEGGRFALLILSHFLKYPMKMKYFGLMGQLRQNYFIFMGHFKSRGVGRGFERTPWLEPSGSATVQHK